MTARPLRVSFDLDDTLICRPPVTAEPLSAWRRWLVAEPLRLGTVGLFRALRARGHSPAIYTTSYRTPRSIRWWLRIHGLRVDAVINQQIHNQVIGCSGPSKFPPAFGFDLHIDDLPGVALEGERYGFITLIIALNDLDWTRAVLSYLDESRLPHRGSSATTRP